MFSYRAYGLTIKSSILIPEFIPVGFEGNLSSPDVSIAIDTHQNPDDCVPPDVAQQRWSLKLNQQEAIVFLKDIVTFRVCAGQSIIIIPAPDVSEQVIRFYLVGTVMAILLYQRGLLVLHASVVGLHSGAIAFLGISGAGKSSTAAAFHAAGYPILTDDVAAVSLDSSSPTVVPGFPQVKLGPEMATYLGHEFDALVPIHPDDDKRGFRVTATFPRSPLPLLRLYTLAYGNFGIAPLSPQDAVMELIRHSRPTTLFHSGGAPHLLQCAQLAKRIPVYRLTRPRGLDLLPHLVRMVEADTQPQTHPLHPQLQP